MQRLPVDISTFSKIKELNCLYVDKTKYIYQMITEGTRYFLSRPRRFGKSLLVSTLNEVLRGNKTLFTDLWIVSSDYEWREHAVINLDFSLLNSKNLKMFKKELCDELFIIAQRYSIVIEKSNEPSFVLKKLIHALFEKYGRVAMLVDEYDSQILKTLKNQKLAVEIRDEIQQFFTTIKGLDAQIQFVFITGVSSFAKAGLFSGINNLQIITLRDKYAAICGYTDDEVDLYFKEYMTAWSDESGMSYDDLREQIRSWYNGYSFGYNVTKVYNPFSVLNLFHAQEFENFWFQSGAPTFLVDILKKEYKKFDPEHFEISKEMLGVFDVGTIPLISLMFQAGYLTIVDYNSRSDVYKLSYPNVEVAKSLQKYLVEVFTHIDVISVQNIFSRIYDAFEEKDIKEVVSLLKQLFAHIPYQLHMQEEKFYHSLFMMICMGAGIKVQAEFSTDDGRIDLIMEFENILYVIEIKFKESAQQALAQIEMKQYYQRFLSLGKRIVLLGLAFKRKARTFDIEYVEKQLC